MGKGANLLPARGTTLRAVDKAAASTSRFAPWGPSPDAGGGQRLHDVGSLGRFADGGHAPLEEVPTMLRRA
jgi:hypothetical protein